jgi:CheY-like chemotaxis protein
VPGPRIDCRVLVVDDNKDNAESLFRMLEAMGCQAEYIIDPLEALGAVARQRPHIAFLDIGMPDIDGYQLAHHIRARYPRDEIALVALTGYASDESRARSRIAGFDAHLAKPASPALVESTLQQFTAGGPGRS